MAYLTAAIGKSLTPDAVEVYFDLLGDLPPAVLLIAVKRVALSHRWATFPTVAELREAAAETMQGKAAVLSAGEAWGMAWRAACKYDPSKSGPHYAGGKLHNSQLDFLCEGLPPLVVDAWRAFGFAALANADPAFARKEFEAIYDGLVANEKRRAILPASVAKAIESIGAKALPAPVQQAVAAIGVQK